MDLIETDAQFQALKEPWSRVYSRDIESGFYLSWGWISALFRQYSSRVRILAVRRFGDYSEQGADGEYVCFYPISTRMRWSKSRQEFQTILEPGGRAGLSELTGILCDPDHESPAIAALADKIAALPWTRFSMRYEPTGRRSKKLLYALPSQGFDGRFEDYLINKGTIDNLICPQIHLPDEYETWLASLSSNTRQKIRRFTRRHLDSGDWQVTQVSDATRDRDIDIALNFWTKRWVGEKGRSNTQRTTTIYRHMMQTAHDMGALHLPILWAGETPLVAHGCIADATRGHVHFVFSGRGTENDVPNSGLLLHCTSIRWAIEAGFGIYDFGHGDEAYKASLGGQNKRLHYLIVDRESENLRELTDPFNFSIAVKRVQSAIDAGKYDDARLLCQELTKIAEAHQANGGWTMQNIKDQEHRIHD